MTEERKKYIGGTIPVRDQHKFEQARLEELLADCLPGYEGPLTVQQFGGGQSNPTYLLVTPKRKYVMRRKPPGTLLKSAHAVDREFRVMTALGQVGFPVPTTYLLCEDESVIGTIFFVMEFVPGRVFWDPLMPDLSPEERGRVYDSMNETLAKLHTIDHEAIGLGDFGRPGNYFARQIARWSKQYIASETETVETMNKLIDWLPGAIPSGDETCLIHGDYSLHNMLMHASEPRLAAVLDWELSTTGHPLGDLTYNTMAWYRPGDNDMSLNRPDLKALGIPTFEEYIARYCERTGRKPIENIAFYKAYNLFRSAAILQGIIGRVRDGTAADASATEFTTDTIRTLADEAWRNAQAAGAI